MSAEGKLKTVLVNNTIKPIMNFTSRSTVFQETNTQKGPLEDVQFANDVRISFNTTQFGSMGVAKISNNYEFIKNLWVEIQVQPTSSINTLLWQPSSSFLAYSLMDEIRITIPGSPFFSYDPRLLPYDYLEQCETMEKRKLFSRLCGEKHKAVGFDYKNKKMGSLVVYAPIPLPGTDLYGKGWDQSKPFPIYLLNSPLEVNIKWKTRSDIQRTHDSSAFDCDITSASLIFNYKVLGTVAQLKKSLYRYQFLMPYNYEYALTPETREVTLYGMRSGETRELLLAFLPNVGLDPHDPYYTTVPRGLTLSYNGQKIWNTGKYEQEIFDLTSGVLPSYWMEHDDGGGAKVYYGTAFHVQMPFSGYVYAASQFTNNAPTAAQLQLASDMMIFDILVMFGYHYEAYNFSHSNGGNTNMFTPANIQSYYLNIVGFIESVINERIQGLTTATLTDLTSSVVANWFNSIRNHLMLSFRRRRNHWIRIPIADLLQRQQNIGDYSLGVDFSHGDLKLSWDDSAVGGSQLDKKGKLFVQIYLTSLLSFDGGVVKLVQ